MTKITGRPKKAIVQEKFIGYYVTRAQYFVILQKAKKAGVTISDYMRQVAIEKQIKPRWTEEERLMIRQLVGMSGELHQLVEKTPKDGAVQTVLYLTRLRDGMDELIKKLRDDR